MTLELPGVVPSPNIWYHPRLYEMENRGVDPDGVIDHAIERVRTLHEAAVVDIGCGAGFHLERLAGEAGTVIGVEPHAPLVELARRRVSALPSAVAARIAVRHGTAQLLPLPDAGVDVAQARWAYFFGPGCEAGLHELDRVVRRGGAAFVVDVDATRSTFGRWFSRAWPRHDARAVERFWARRWWSREQLTIRWAMPTPADLAAVVRIEFAPEAARSALAELDPSSCEVDYAVNLWWRRF